MEKSKHESQPDCPDCGWPKNDCNCIDKSQGRINLKWAEAALDEQDS